MNENLRLTAHVVLDGLVAFDPERLLTDDPRAAEPARLALARLNETGAVVAHQDTTTGAVNVDVSVLLGATSTSIFWFATQLAQARGTSREAVIAELRQHLDEGE